MYIVRMVKPEDLLHTLSENVANHSLSITLFGILLSSNMIIKHADSDSQKAVSTVYSCQLFRGLYVGILISE